MQDSSSDVLLDKRKTGKLTPFGVIITKKHTRKMRIHRYFKFSKFKLKNNDLWRRYLREILIISFLRFLFQCISVTQW